MEKPMRVGKDITFDNCKGKELWIASKWNHNAFNVFSNLLKKKLISLWNQKVH